MVIETYQHTGQQSMNFDGDSESVILKRGEHGEKKVHREEPKLAQQILEPDLALCT